MRELKSGSLSRNQKYTASSTPQQRCRPGRTSSLHRAHWECFSFSSYILLTALVCCVASPACLKRSQQSSFRFLPSRFLSRGKFQNGMKCIFFYKMPSPSGKKNRGILDYRCTCRVLDEPSDKCQHFSKTSSSKPEISRFSVIPHRVLVYISLGWFFIRLFSGFIYFKRLGFCAFSRRSRSYHVSLPSKLARHKNVGKKRDGNSLERAKLSMSNGTFCPLPPPSPRQFPYLRERDTPAIDLPPEKIR